MENSQVDLHAVANYLNECLEHSPHIVQSFMNIHVAGHANDAKSRMFALAADGGIAMFGVLGLLSGMGDGNSIVAPVHSTEGKLIGFAVRSVNGSTDKPEETK